MYRYWTGAEWTPYLNASPAAPPPSSVGYDPYQQAAPKQKSHKTWLIAAVAAVTVVALAVFFVAWSGASLPYQDPEPMPTEVGSFCPEPNLETKQSPEVVGDRVVGGKLSYQVLGSPWGSPEVDYRLAFADWALEQMVPDQMNYDSNHSWVSTVLIAEVYSGDGFGGVKVGAEMILECAKGVFYGDGVDSKVTQETLQSVAYPVDGHAGWLIDAKLHFSIKNLNATYDRVLFLLVETGDNEYSVFYASIPNTSEYLLPDALAAMETLRVDG
jgi:hypothetical protein